MAHYWDYGAIVGSTWHGQQNTRGVQLPPGTSVERGIDLSRIRELSWHKIPVVARSGSGRVVSVDGQYLLEREPRPWQPGDDWYILPGRQVTEEFEIVQGADLAEMAESVAKHTGWQFMGAAHLKDSEICFVQLEIDRDFMIAGKRHEAHKAKLFFGDDKSGGSTFGGITYTRIQCWNTWRAALSGEGVWRLRHDDSPKARLEFASAQIVQAYKAMGEEEEWLNRFFTAPLADHLFDAFTHNVFPDPPVTKAMMEGEEAYALIRAGQTNGYDLDKVVELGEKSKESYEQRLDLARRRRSYMESSYERHNRKFGDSANTFYAGAQALTATTSHGPFRGSNELQTMFGTRADFTTRGFSWLKDALVEQEGG